jgi:DNA-directed RNA polymerase specialized sigma24 family protein
MSEKGSNPRNKPSARELVLAMGSGQTPRRVVAEYLGITVAEVECAEKRGLEKLRDRMREAVAFGKAWEG